MSQEELIDVFVKGYGELAQVCGYTTEQIEKAEKVIAWMPLLAPFEPQKVRNKDDKQGKV